MRLKRLKVFGFKSFADVSTIDFIDGITAVVGPNGCGKSNISDAFRWVLGEQSAKSLRGRGMTDVIFAGTSTRKPLNYAEVSLTLSEVNGQLPIDYDEVTITRRLHRSGESEYFINNHAVRYRDIQSLFMDSGIGRSAFSIFEQGKIDQVINLSPLERRYLFEEAAGILRFLQRKREALKKLEETEQNMERIEDLYQEVIRQVEVLGRQAEEARHYKDKKSQLEALQTAVLCARWEALDLVVRQLEDKEKAKAESVIVSQDALQERQHDSRQSREALVQSEHRLSLQRQEIVKVQTTIEHTIENRTKHRDRLDEAITAQQKREHELKEVLAGRTTRRSEMEACEERLEEIKDRLADAEAALKKRHQQFAVNEERVTALWRQQQHSQQEQLRLVQAQAKVEGDLNQSLALLNASQQRLTTLDVEKEGLGQRIEGLTEVAAQREAALEALGSQVTSNRDKLEVLSGTIEELQQRHTVKQRDLQDLDKTITELQARHKVLEQLRDSGEGLAKGTKNLLQSPLKSLFKPLYELLSMQKEYESHVASALQHYTDTLVVDTVDDLKAVLNYIAAENIVGFSLMCRELMRKVKPVQNSLSGHCEGDIAYSLLAQTILSDDLDSSLTLVSKDAVSVCLSNGLHIDSYGIISKSDQGNRNAFMRESELRTISSQLEHLEDQRINADQARKQILERLEIVERESTELRDQLRRGEMQTMDANFAWQQAVSDLGKAKSEKERVDISAQEVSATVQKLVAQVEEFRQQVSSAKGNTAAAQESIADLEDQVEELKEQLRLEKQSLHADEVAHERIADENRKLSHTLSLLAVKDHESQIQEKRLESEIKHAKELQERLNTEEHDHGTRLEATEKRLERLLAAQKQTEDEVLLGRQKVETLEHEIEAEAGRLKRREKEVHEIGIQKTHQTALLQAFSQELLENHRIDVTIHREEFPELEGSLPEAEQLVKALKEEVERGGNVNMTSIEDYEAQKIRSEGLQGQLHDLRASQKELQQIIAELDGESRRLFTATFTTIRAKFQEIFQILFRGGEADLCLTDEGDVLSAGIEIVAKPPGKQMRSIHLMSGGEKCLTALALLFALFEVKPSPFCLLDEIDAPLDDSNVGRFAAMLKHFVDRCQFIVITHNKCTMAVADVLVGVSMQEKGVSKVLTFDFARNEVAVN
ncbi:MAG: chromosome segregation protein SMC [Chlamydiales bacterium]|nr:chromosome segregation protein SMC [Chlamydiales bacterium]